VIIADDLKRFCRSFHAVTAQSAVHVKINEAGREIIFVKINNLVCAGMATFADCADSSFFNNELKALPNAIAKNQTRVGKDHFVQCSVTKHECRMFDLALGA